MERLLTPTSLLVFLLAAKPATATTTTLNAETIESGHYAGAHISFRLHAGKVENFHIYGNAMPFHASKTLHGHVWETFFFVNPPTTTSTRLGRRLTAPR